MNWQTVRAYDFITDAQIALGKLQANGIPAQLADQHLVQTDWLYANVVGGIKVQVLAHNLQQAERLLSEDLSALAEHQYQADKTKP